MSQLICQKCGRAWDTRSTLRYVTCPNCLTKVKNNLEAPTHDHRDSVQPRV